MRLLLILGISVVIGAGLGTWIVLSCVLKPQERTLDGVSSISPSPGDHAHFTGTASCSGRACHGRLEANSDHQRIQGDEHTTWQIHDRHAKAYSVLLEGRSKTMAKLVDGKEAVQDKRCLACHVDQEIGHSNSDLSGLEFNSGVGCETCHGAAGNWLGPHTGVAWGKLDAGQKKERGMTDLSGARERAELCVRCHVGTGEYQVVHDLIAAGHPRLEFDLPAFLANMPPHWREKDKPEPEAEIWRIGQLVTAQTALQLLAHRADPEKGNAWPEFAEYDCFACHHALSDAKWRRDPQHFKDRSLGSAPWNRRYLTFLPELLGKEAEAHLAEVGQAMSRPLPDRRKIRDLCDALEKLFKSGERKKLSGADLLQGIANHPARFVESWDAAAQAYLAVDALSRSLGTLAETESPLKKLGEMLEFPPDANSPTRFRAPPHSDRLNDAIRDAALAALRSSKP